MREEDAELEGGSGAPERSPTVSASGDRRALVSGASIAGPALAYWLTRNGWSVTLVERAARVRGGGYPIDLRGTAVEVAKRMGIYDAVRQRQVGRRSIEILNQRGRRIAVLDLSADVLNDDSAGDVELPRGDLATILYELTRDRVDYVFNESVATITAHDDRVDVTFVSGRADSFDIVVGADGIHSTTRRLVFGPEEAFIHHLGPVVAIFDANDDPSLALGSGSMFNLPGRVASFGRASTGGTRGFFSYVVDDPASIDLADPEQAPRLAREAFRGHEVPVVQKLIVAMESADDVFFDTVSQIRMDTWHTNRVALVGDSAYAPSFLSGQGTGIALIGAYVLATELAGHAEPLAAFAAYETKMREFIERNQAVALRTKKSNVLPRDSRALRERNLVYWALPWIRRLRLTRFLDRGVGDVATSLSIDGYGLT